MALLTLKDIGKIYVSEGNVAVGIRGVNLSFDRGEFVAVTGKSGSGKSTLLNVISGMDSYEEGELYIDGQSTSHYLQPEWEEYREKYISFIFQDYNIIESFTVLQNVELALMHIEDKKERRARALELLDRVGLTSHIKQKGSKLSGGQKQRTVIARALAKDSPIILADEPTGNLDSATSKEIIELLREVSKDKLLIVVTHNFEQVEACATRHIRIFDGAVESDHVINAAESAKTEKTKKAAEKPDRKKEIKRELKNGFTLGHTIFTAKPRLSAFLCMLMILGTFGVFMITTLCGSASELFEPYYMFNHIEGRVILAKQSGEVFTNEEIERIAEEYGAKKHLRFDVLLDKSYGDWTTLPNADEDGDDVYVNLEATYGEDFGDDIIGRYPEKAGEVFLYLPISYQPYMGKDSVKVEEIVMNSMTLRVTGVKYYYDNNLPAKCLFTEEGFRTATAVYYMNRNAKLTMSLTVQGADGKAETVGIYSFITSFDMPSDKIYVSPEVYSYMLRENKDEDVKLTLNWIARYQNYNYYYDGMDTEMIFRKTFEDGSFTNTMPTVNTYGEAVSYEAVYVSDELLREIAENVLDLSYKQASVFFETDKEAHAAAELLQKAGYIAVPSDTSYTPDAAETILGVMSAIMMAFMWFMGVVFLAFFINLCSTRTLEAFKGDMAIMRSMGISVKVIRIGMYVRMLISLIPAFIFVIAGAFVIFTSPTLNEYFVYLYPWQYALIFVGMLILTVRITYKQIRRLFGESVKRSLKGGEE